jgi:hypothetical protein
LYSLADPLKQKVCIDILGLSYEQCYGSDEAKNSITKLKWEDLPIQVIEEYRHHKDPIFLTAREVMEIVGTKFFRRLFENVWIDSTLRQIKQDDPDYAIVLDVRFPNEVEGFLRHSGQVIRLTLNPFNSKAAAETALDEDKFDWKKFSYVLCNNGLSQEEKNSLLISYLVKNNIIKVLS